MICFKLIDNLPQGPKNQADLSVYVLEKGGAKAKYLTNKVVDDRSVKNKCSNLCRFPIS